MCQPWERDKNIPKPKISLRRVISQLSFGAVCAFAIYAAMFRHHLRDPIKTEK